MNAIILNTSGHRCPESVINYLKEKKYKRYSMYSIVENYDLVNEDIWKQVEKTIKSLAEKKDAWGEKFSEQEGEVFITVPALSVAAVLLVIGITKILGIAPTLLVITRVGKKSELTQCVDMRAWEAMCRTKLRNEIVLSDQGKTLVA